MTVRALDYLRAIADDRELTSSERLIALMVMRHAGNDGRNSHPGAKLLAEETGLHVNTVRPALRKLEEKKWLVQIYCGRGGDHRASEYDLNIPNHN